MNWYEQHRKDGQQHRDVSRWLQWLVSNSPGGLIPRGMAVSIYRNDAEREDGE